MSTAAVARIVGLAALAASWMATAALAQSGSVGGAIGKGDKSISGTQEAPRA